MKIQNEKYVLYKCLKCKRESYPWEVDLFKKAFKNKKNISQYCFHCSGNQPHQVIGKVSMVVLRYKQ